jgi:hypothetical protein
MLELYILKGEGRKATGEKGICISVEERITLKILFQM